MNQIQIITTPEQLKELMASLMFGLIARPLPAEAAELEVLKRKDDLTTEEVAKLYPLNANTLRKLRMNGKGPAYSKVDGKVTYSKKAIRQYLDSGRQKTIDQP